AKGSAPRFHDYCRTRHNSLERREIAQAGSCALQPKFRSGAEELLNFIVHLEPCIDVLSVLAQHQLGELTDLDTAITNGSVSSFHAPGIVESNSNIVASLHPGSDAQPCDDSERGDRNRPDPSGPSGVLYC